VNLQLHCWPRDPGLALSLALAGGLGIDIAGLVNITGWKCDDNTLLPINWSIFLLSHNDIAYIRWLNSHHEMLHGKTDLFHMRK